MEYISTQPSCTLQQHTQFCNNTQNLNLAATHPALFKKKMDQLLTASKSTFGQYLVVPYRVIDDAWSKLLKTDDGKAVQSYARTHRNCFTAENSHLPKLWKVGMVYNMNKRKHKIMGPLLAERKLYEQRLAPLIKSLHQQHTQAQQLVGQHFVIQGFRLYTRTRFIGYETGPTMPSSSPGLCPLHDATFDNREDDRRFVWGDVVAVMTRCSPIQPWCGDDLEFTAECQIRLACHALCTHQAPGTTLIQCKFQCMLQDRRHKIASITTTFYMQTTRNVFCNMGGVEIKGVYKEAGWEVQSLMELQKAQVFPKEVYELVSAFVQPGVQRGLWKRQP